MSVNCDRIRQRALEHGRGSVEYYVWVRHARHCSACRNEIYLEGLLEEDRFTGGHLPQESVSRLVQLANDRYSGGRHRHDRLYRRLAGWGVRAAVFVGLVYGISLMSPQLFEGSSSWELPRVQGRAEMAAAPASVASSPVSAPAVMSAGDPLEAAEDLSYDPEMLSGWELEHQLQDCRQGIDRQHRNVIDDFDTDFEYTVR